MAQQNSTYYSSHRDDSKPRHFPTHSYTACPRQTVTGQEMTRHLSKDSAYYSSASDDAYYSKQSSPTTMPYEPDETFYSQYSHDNSQHSSSVRPTPLNLGWFDNELLSLYKFVVQKGKEPFFELLPTCLVTIQTPKIVYLDSPRTPQKNVYPCQYPACDDPKIFKRPADLERHYRNVHAPLDQKEQYPCDYGKCQEGRGPFTRKDHFRDHLRDYHKEDVGCAKGEKQTENRKAWIKAQEAWVRERKIEAKWWRCPKCLFRVHIAESGYECQPCKYLCDLERRNRIEAVREKGSALGATASGTTGMEDVQYAAVSSTTTYTANCAACGDTAWIWNAYNRTWDACQTCQPPQTYKSEDVWDGAATYSSMFE